MCSNHIFKSASMFALLVLVPLSSGGLVSKFEQRGQVDPWRHPGCPQTTNGPLLTIPVWPPDIIGRTVQVGNFTKNILLMADLGRCAASRSVLLFL